MKKLTVSKNEPFKIKCPECEREWALLDLIGMDKRDFEMIEKGNCPFCGEKL